MEQPFKPEETETDLEMMRAYEEISKETESPYVFLSALIEKSGLDKEAVHEYVLMKEEEGKATLSSGDWASASEQEREAVLESRKKKMIKVNLNPVLD